MKIRRSFVGHKLGPTAHTVDAERVKAYAIATNDERPAYTDNLVAAEAVAPPLFAVVPQMPLVSAMITDLSLPLDKILQGAQDMTFTAPIRPGEELVSEGQVVDIADTLTGQRIATEIVTRTQEGEPRVRSLMTIVVRDSSISRPRHAASTKSIRRQPLAHHTIVVRPEQPQIYAVASGDHNPPHTDESFAKAVGFRTVILQGLCTMAFASKAVVDSVCEGDPTRLKRLKARFSNVVYPDDILSTAIWAHNASYAFETANQDGALVIKRGEAEVTRTGTSGGSII